MDRLILLLLAVVVIFSAATYVLWRLTKGKKAMILPILCLVLGIYNIYIARTGTTEGFRSLAGVIYAMMFFAAFIASLATVLVLNYRKKRRSSIE